MTAQTIVDELKTLGREGYRKVLLNHGVNERCFGVKIEELKKIQKRIKKDYRLALDLYNTGIYDAQYLAGLIADDEKMTKEDLRGWARNSCGPLAGFTVPWVAAGSPHGWEMAREWIKSEQVLEAVAGWATLSCLISITPDDQLDLPELERLLEQVRRAIHTAPNKVRYQMNDFLIAAGCYVKALTQRALRIGEAIGPVSVDMGNTACKVPFAPDYIRKVEKRGTLGKKRSKLKC